MAKKPIKTAKEPSLPDKISKFIHDNLKLLTVALCAFAFIGLAVVGYGYIKKGKELKIESDLYTDRAKLTELLKVEDPAKKPSFESVQAAASGLENKILSYNGSKAATTAALELGGIYVDYEKHDLVKNLMQKLNASKGVLSSLVNQQLATALFELKDYKAAIAKFDSIISSKSQSFLHADSLIKKGLAHQQLGELDKAKAALQQVTEEYAGKSVADTASKYLRVLNFKTN